MIGNQTSRLEAVTAETHRIWVNANYYVRVDSEGFIMGTCYEGALGCVIPLLSAFDNNRLALKIPRMLADTVRENAFISQVVNAESMIVYRANEEYKATAGLIPVQALGRDVLRGIRELRNASSPEARRQDGCILLFSFRKDRNPRICAVKYEGGERISFPPGCDDALAFMTRARWEGAHAAACAVDVPESSSYFFEVPRHHDSADMTAGVLHARLSSTMMASEWSDVWFGALPSILYNWANGTLQEAVSQDRLQSWSLGQHYELCCRVLRGVDTLHSKKFIHGDLRPANIMTCGPANVPEDYVVGDYGSFSEDFSQLGSPQTGGSGHTTTMVGGLGRHRTSLFYAPERRNGVERETADVALILSTLDDVDVKDEYFIYFGWRSCMLDSQTNAPDERLLRTLRSDWRRMIHTKRDSDRAPVGDRLARGDRLRVREFIFSVLDSEEFDDAGDAGPGDQGNHAKSAAIGRRVVFRCHRRYAQVLHERLTVYDNSDGLADCTVIGLPNYVELRQWSVATDLYGAGSLVLYTVFMSGLRRGLAAAADLPSPTQAGGDTMGNAETLLAQMLEILEGIPTFLALWSDLEDFCWNIEHPDHANLSGPDLARVEILHRPGIYPDSGPGQSAAFSSGDPQARRTIGGFALRTVNNLLRSVPNIRYVLHVFQVNETPRVGSARQASSYNAAHFLLFVHFVMASLHRRSHLRDAAEMDVSYPFCRDRCHETGANGPAQRALARLEELKRRLLQPRYDAIVVQDQQLVNFDPRDVMQIRIEHAQLGRELALRNRELDELRPQYTAAIAALGERDRIYAGATAEVDELKQAREAAYKQITQLDAQCDAARTSLASSQRDLATLRSEMLTLREELQRARKEGDVDAETARRQCMSLQERVDRLEAESAATTARLSQKEGVSQSLAAQLAQIDEEMRGLMSNMYGSMGQCLADLAAIQTTGWRVPQGKVDRLASVLNIWRNWAARQGSANPGPEHNDTHTVAPDA